MVKIWVRLFCAVSLAAIAAARSEAQCPGPNPQFSSIVDTDPVFLSYCAQLTPSGGCRAPEPPTLVAGSVRVQEATVQAVVPAGFQATDVHWMALHRNSESDPVEELWTYRSTAGAPFNGGATVTLGAPGLIADEQHLFRVSFCDADECFCWSAPGALATTSNFSSTAPGPPGVSPLKEVEEQFVRAVTAFRETGGEGLGPTPVWVDTGCKVVDGPDADALGDSVEFRHSSIACREAVSTYEHAWAEILVSTDRTGAEPAEYNADVYAREFTPTGASRPNAHYAKVVSEDGLYGGTQGNPKPNIVLGRLTHDENNNPIRHDLLVFSLENTGQSKCPTNGILPLTEADPTNGTRSKSVWLRIEVTDDQDVGRAKLRGFVAWNCSSGPIENCDNVCQTSWVEDTNAAMFFQRGHTGFGGHHKTHFATHFRTGSISTP